MNKYLIYGSIGVFTIISISISSYLYINKNKKENMVMCPTDIMMCPDGSSVPRSGKDCEFGVCPQENNFNAINNVSTNTEERPKEQIKTESKKENKTTIINTIKQNTNTVVEQIKNIFVSQKENTKEVPINTTAQNTNTNLNETKNTEQSSPVNETRYLIINNSIVDGSTTIYIINNSSGGGNFVNAISVGNVAPVLGAVPVEGLPGKYYVSENTLSNEGGCVFSNKIYILDTSNNTLTLMYEENNTTLSIDDPRACINDIYLLATENEKLILKYHTVGTNMICDTTWSEPEKTWYLDVTNLSVGMRRYSIPTSLYLTAEQKEQECREEKENKAEGEGEANNG